MAESTTEGEDQRKVVAELASHVEAARRLADNARSDTEKQSQALTSLDARIAEIQSSANEAIRSVHAHAAVIAAMRERGEVALKQIEEDARKANSESGFAFNAKGNAEEHAKAIAQMRGVVESTFSGMTSTKAQTEVLVQAIAIARTDAESDAKTVAKTKAGVERDAALATAASERVTAVLPSIEQGSKDANAITAAKTGADASAAAILSLQTQMSEATAKAMSDAASITRADDDSKQLITSMTDARNRANESSARLVTYEEEIKRQTVAFSDMQIKLEGLLPHATSVGLASAFHVQKARFSKPQPYWLGLFVAAIVALLAAAGLGLPAASDTWDAILRHFVNRLPIVAPLVWLAIYAGHHYNMALRMEEDYAFKEAVSTAFEGYKREMLAIPASAGSDVSPLVTLCENVLRALAERPGRIYDGKTDVVTPLTPAASVLKEMIAEYMKGKGLKP